MTKKNRILAAILAMALVFVMLFSVAFIFENAEHDCVGDTCSVCAELAICMNTLHAFSAVAAVVVSAFLFSRIAHVFYNTYKKETGYFSLVSLKVKLSD